MHTRDVPIRASARGGENKSRDHVPSCQINKETGMMEASRIMNLYQFIQLYHDITSQAAEVLSAEGAAMLPSTESCQASMWMGRYPHF